MRKRTARNRAEIDLLPPFGEPEVVVLGPAAWLIAASAAAAVLLKFND